MKIRLGLPALLLLVLIAAACAPPPVLRSDKFLHDDSLVTDDPCEAPCWRGIVPGETTWRDAIAVIENDRSLAELQIQEDENSSAKLAVWKEVDGESCCQMSTADGETVQSVVLLVSPEMTLGQVIDQHGDPDYVVGTPVTDDQAVLNLFYLDPPMLIYAFVEGEATGKLSASSEIIGLIYTTKDDLQTVIEGVSLYAWDGYLSYQDYASKDFTVTAVPTIEGSEG